MFGMQPAPGSEPANPFLSFLPFLLIIVVIYFLMIRPQVKRQKEREKLLGSVKKGDKIITAGGIHGTVVGIKEKENTLIVKIDDNVKVELERGSVSTIKRSAEETAQIGESKQ
jgi:preprotein translocase subunit YajC